MWLFLCVGREWTGDLKKLPNIKLRKVSCKGLDMNEKEDKPDTVEEDVGGEKELHDDDDEDDEDKEVEEKALMTDSD